MAPGRSRGSLDENFRGSGGFGIFGRGFRREIGGRSWQVVRLGDTAFGVSPLGEPEVGDVGMVGAIKENVGGFEVAMDDSPLVGKSYGEGAAAHIIFNEPGPEAGLAETSGKLLI